MKISGTFILLLPSLVLGNRHGLITFLEPNCGVAISESGNSPYRIIGGVIGNMFASPWMAFIIALYPCVYNPGFTCVYTCGGSLITKRFVLSAAHCKFTSQTNIKLGEFDRSKSNPNAIEIPAEDQIRHPNFSEKDRQIKYDISLYRLARPVSYTEYIRPICLATNFNPLAKTKYLTATGWGQTQHGGYSSVLMTATLAVHNRSICASHFGEHVDMSQICAGTSDSQTCAGDSGGPILGIYRIHGTNRAIQLGVVSYGGVNCTSVGVYTSAWYYISWIADVVGRSRSKTT